MQANVVTQERTDEPETKRETPSGRWIIAVDRAQRLLADTIASLESGGDVGLALEDLRAAHRLVNGSEGAR